MMLPHLATRLYDTPLLIQPAKLDAILSVLGDRVGWPVAEAPVPLPPPRVLAEGTPGIAVIAVHGSLVRRSLSIDPASGLTSYTDIGRQLDQALADPVIQAILLDVDSPGGEAGGAFELGERIRLASTLKPVWAVAADSAFSAAYAIACGASRLLVSRTGGVGSIGVIALHLDQSLRDAQDGYRFTAIHAGERKNDFSPHAPLSDAATARLQAEVDRLYGLFVTHVAGLRGLSEDAVRGTEAGLFFGPEAVESGLADAEGSLDSALLELTDWLAPPRLTRPSESRLIDSSPVLETLTMNAPELPDTAEHEATPGPDDPDAENRDEAPQTAETPESAPAASASTTLHPVDARAEALAIAELCQLAGQSDRILGFLAEGATPEQVRRALLASRADSPEVASRLHPDAAAQAASPEHGPLMRAVRRMIGQ
ncbi:S49 family peptidase [Methylolobus aquaticus]|nr:S49 family peptidase [Methylolobus aquaticus]